MRKALTDQDPDFIQGPGAAIAQGRPGENPSLFVQYKNRQVSHD